MVTSQIETDYIYFGFGKITNYLINYNRWEGKRVVCVTNQTDVVTSDRTTTFVDYAYLPELEVNSKTAIFNWKEVNTLNSTALEWVASNSFSARKSFLLSSASLYRESDIPIKEDDSNLEENYSENNKYILEQVIGRILREKSIVHTNLRLSNVFGENLNYGFIANLLNSLRNQKPAVIFNQTSITRDFLYIEDLRTAIAKLSKMEFSEENLNLGSGIGITIDRVLEVFSFLGFEITDVIYADAPENIRQKVVLDCTKLKEIIDWKPKDFEASIKRILETSSPTT